MTAPIITLLTDFGMEDTYVASIKGVILGICPDARLVDISHLVPPQDVRAGAFLLVSVYRDFPPGTIHLAVIDPGVGTDRRGLVIRTGDYSFVGPDNGLFSWILREASGWEAFSLERPAYWRTNISKTFHGRDIFSPTAAHLALGVPAEALGSPCIPQMASWTSAVHKKEELVGEIIHIDHFGNAITNVNHTVLEDFLSGSPATVEVGGFTISGIADTYGDHKAGTLVALIGSSHFLEIAISQGNAAKDCDLRRGDLVRIVRKAGVGGEK